MIPNPTRILAVLLAVAATTGCAKRFIPGTEIPDTDDTQAIVALLTKYRQALEARDAPAIIGLVSDRYYDNAGTPNPEDDLRYADLSNVLPRRLQALENLRVELEVRRIDVENDQAVAVIHYTTKYRIARFDTRQLGDSDLAQMRFTKAGGEWKILSGL